MTIYSRSRLLATLLDQGEMCQTIIVVGDWLLYLLIYLFIKHYF